DWSWTVMSGAERLSVETRRVVSRIRAPPWAALHVTWIVTGWIVAVPKRRKCQCLLPVGDNPRDISPPGGDLVPGVADIHIPRVMIEFQIRSGRPVHGLPWTPRERARDGLRGACAQPQTGYRYPAREDCSRDDLLERSTHVKIVPPRPSPNIGTFTYFFGGQVLFSGQPKVRGAGRRSRAALPTPHRRRPYRRARTTSTPELCAIPTASVPARRRR